MLAREFGFSIGLSVICLVLATFYGYNNGGVATAFSYFTIAVILGVMELSLSFDNAVVNASVLKNMSPVWQQRFLTWGILIAVFGMRFIFPIVIVAIVANLGFLEVVNMAFTDSARYAKALTSAHIPISAFGSTFLMLVFFKYLMDPDKDVHWLAPIEKRLAKIGRLDTIQVFLTGLFLVLAVQFLVHHEEQFSALLAGMIGILVYVFVDALGGLFNADDMAANAGKAGFASFLYLEVLDASFSLDGVIGAFAITRDVVVIAAGLCIGAAFVRSITLLLVKRNTLQAYRYLEHGAHYGIGALAFIMLLSTNHDIKIPELVTGLIGVAFIVWSIFSTMQYNKNNPTPSE